jgi:hypothetical protein
MPNWNSDEAHRLRSKLRLQGRELLQFIDSACQMFHSRSDLSADIVNEFLDSYPKGSDYTSKDLKMALRYAITASPVSAQHLHLFFRNTSINLL